MLRKAFAGEMDLPIQEIALVTAALIGGGATLLATRMQTRAQRDQHDRKSACCVAKCLYAKVVRFGVEREGVEPAYSADASRSPEAPLEVGVYDETVYTSVELFDKPRSDHEYGFRSAGVADLLCLYPWRPRLRFTDRGAAGDPHQVRQVFGDQASPAYVVVAHGYNGLQPGSEDFGVRMPEDVAEGRLVVDLSSVPEVVAAMTAIPRGELRAERGESAMLSVLEYRRGVYCIEHRDLRKNDVLLLDLTIDWGKL